MNTSIVTQPSIVVLEAPTVVLYDVWSHRANRAPLQANTRPATLSEARSLIALLRSDPYAVGAQEFEIVAASERAATMPELLRQLHELQELVTDLQERLEEAQA